MNVEALLKKPLLIMLPPLFIILILSGTAFSIAGENDNDDAIVSSINLSASVEEYRGAVKKVAHEQALDEYVDLILCIMQAESGGTGTDPMQSSEGPFNKRYPQRPNGITDPTYSIECGVKEFKDCMQRANVKDPNDIENIKVALAGYNFGNGYIEWCQSKYSGKWSLKTAQEFSDIWKNRLGWITYGDPPYADKVMQYYQAKDESISGIDAFLVPLKNYVITCDFGYRSLDGFHHGIDISGSYGDNIYAPADSKVYASYNGCDPDGGYIGNHCPVSGYSGGGNYVVLEVQYKQETYYIFMCHMKKMTVKTGQTIKKGQKVGEQGQSGNSTGTHVHVEIHKGTPIMHTKDGLIDPHKLMKFK